MIADQLKTQFDIALDKKKIYLEHPIKTLGEHDIELRLHAEVNATLKVRVESTTPVAEPPAAAPGARPAEGRDGVRTESRGHKRADKMREEGAAGRDVPKRRRARKRNRARPRWKRPRNRKRPPSRPKPKKPDYERDLYVLSTPTPRMG